MTAPPDEQQGKISEKLSTGVALLTAVLGVVAGYEGGLARTALNYNGLLNVSTGLILSGIAVAVLSWISVGNNPLWALLIVASLLLTAAGLGLAVFASKQASVAYDRPSVSTQYDGSTLTFEAKISLLPADDSMTVTATGYPPYADAIPLGPGDEGEDRGAQLYFAVTGPAPNGDATLSGKISVAPTAFETVEVRVYRNAIDPNCLTQNSDRPDLAACSTVWLTPRPPRLAPAPG